MKPAKPVKQPYKKASLTGIAAHRPTIFSDQIANEICVWISEGKSLNRYCQQPGSVSKSVIYQWLTSNKRNKSGLCSNKLTVFMNGQLIKCCIGFVIARKQK